jgi:outer membrane protein OmpA-like peptidoglycan-associated protein
MAVRILTLIFLLLSYSVCIAQQDTANIYFSIGSYQLTVVQKKSIDSLLYHDVIAPGRRIGIIGYADVVGGEVSNKLLSVKRANAVAAYLQYMGIDSQFIEQVTGAGEISRAANKDGYPQDRKVSIVPGGFSKRGWNTKTIATSKVISGTVDSPVINIANVPLNGTFRLENVYFDFGKAELLPSSFPVLNALAKVLIDNPNLKIQVEGHVCCSKPYTIDANGQKRELKEGEVDTVSLFTTIGELSVDRAQAVRIYLIFRKGINDKRIKFVGFGNKRMIVNPEVTDADKAQNRRVEVRVIAK